MHSMLKYIMGLMLFVGLGGLSAQINPPIKNFRVIPNSVVDTISAFGQPTYRLPAGHPIQQLNISQVSPGRWRIEMIFPQDFRGSENVIIEYLRYFPLRVHHIVYNITIESSIVTAVDDIILYNGIDPLVINPLDNDFSTHGDVSLKDIAQIMYGSAENDGESIVYSGFPIDLGHDYIVYTVEDSLGSMGQGIIYILDENFDFSGNDTIFSVITHHNEKTIILPNADFSPSNTPGGGRLVELGTMAFRYIPNNGYIGTQNIRFEDNDNNTIVHNIRVISADNDPGIVKDDEFYTPRNTSVSFNVFDNDLRNDFPLIAYSPELEYQGSGVFNYTPPQGFTGVRNFFYRIRYNHVTETGNIVINVGNIRPVVSINYEFIVPADNDFVIEYNVPIEGYSFNLLNAPMHGTVETLIEGESITLDCGTASAKALILYTPDLGYFGQDEFDIQYCIHDEQCTIYKIRLNIDADTQECTCVTACVWQGDANADGRVNVRDLLSIGRFLGYGGAPREGNTFDFWYAEESEDWMAQQHNGKNVKHADTNGDGFISAEDISAIDDNYGKISSLVPDEFLVIKDAQVRLDILNPDVEPGDRLFIDVYVGDSENPLFESHGVVLGLNINPGLIDSGSLEFHYLENDWFAANTPSLQMVKQPFAGQIESAFTRTSGLPVSGYGIIAKFSFIVEEEIVGVRDDFENEVRVLDAPIFLSEAEGEDGNGRRFALPLTQSNFRIHLNKEEEVEQELSEKLMLFPNPASDRLQLHYNGNNIIRDVDIFDINGRLVFQRNNVLSKTYAINLNPFTQGVYFVRVISDNGVVTKKISIIK
jgi:hypothetical protein